MVNIPTWNGYFATNAEMQEDERAFAMAAMKPLHVKNLKLDVTMSVLVVLERNISIVHGKLD